MFTLKQLHQTRGYAFSRWLTKMYLGEVASLKLESKLCVLSLE